MCYKRILIFSQVAPTEISSQYLAAPSPTCLWVNLTPPSLTPKSSQEIRVNFSYLINNPLTQVSTSMALIKVIIFSHPDYLVSLFLSCYPAKFSPFSKCQDSFKIPVRLYNPPAPNPLKFHKIVSKIFSMKHQVVHQMFLVSGFISSHSRLISHC